MKKFRLFLSIFFFASTLASAQVKPASKQQLTRILFVFDCSQSMFGRWESGVKMDVSKKLLLEALDSLGTIPNLELALRLYGHQHGLYPQRDCEDTRLEVPFEPNNIQKIKNKIKEVQPKGTTPIAYTLERCANDFPSAETRNIVILITDGVEECDGDPCAVSLALQKKGIVLRPYVIGIGLDVEFKKTFECVGNYFNANTEAAFKTAMGIIINQALNSTTAQVNLLDAFGKPSETNVPYTLYNSHSDLMEYNYVHTINNKGNPDTIILDPVPTYRLVVHTIPPIEKDKITITPGKHNIIGIDAPQGDLILKTTAVNDYKNLQFIVRKKGEMKTLNVQEINKTQRYITGKYDLEILCLPRLTIPDVDISQSKTTTVQIPQPGMANVLMNGPGYGKVFVEEKNNLRFVYDLPDNSTRETIILQPGRYRILYRSKSSKETIYTVERSFNIISGGSETVKLY